MKDFMDAEYESIRCVMERRGTTGGQLKRVPVVMVSKDRADHLDKMEQRLQKVQIILPFVICALGFIAGSMIF